MLNVNNSNLIKSKALSPVTPFQSCYSQSESGLILLEAEMGICTIEGCERKQHARGYCKKHYLRWQRHGDALYIKQIRHGMINTSEYESWCALKRRCLNQNNPAYHRYGGRGIAVCKRWQDSFQAFYDDMGDKPFARAQIDRIDNDGNYEPGNCRWVTAKENTRNGSWVKLSMQKAEEIRDLYKKGGISQKRLAALYDVSQRLIWSIVRNKIWVAQSRGQR